MTTLGCQAFAARQWLSRRPNPSSTLLLSAPVEIRSAGEGRGLGLYASRRIEPFSQVLSDTPLILMQPKDDLPELYQQFAQMHEDDRKKYMLLSYQHNPAREALLKDKLLERGFGKAGLDEMATVASIMQTNAFNVDLNDGKGSTHRALFAQIARINHSCAPNAHVCFYPPLETGGKGRMVVHSLTSLHPGEEILIAYFNLLLPKAERQAKAQKWGFNCLCPVCDTTPPDNTDAEEVRKAFRNFTARQAKVMDSARVTAKDINALLITGTTLIEQTAHKSALFPKLPDLHDEVAMLHAKALLIQKQDDQREKVMSHLEQAAIWEARITGLESPATSKRLAKVHQFAARRGQASKPRITIDEENLYRIDWGT